MGHSMLDQIQMPQWRQILQASKILFSFPRLWVVHQIWETMPLLLSNSLNSSILLMLELLVLFYPSQSATNLSLNLLQTSKEPSHLSIRSSEGQEGPEVILSPPLDMAVRLSLTILTALMHLVRLMKMQEKI